MGASYLPRTCGMLRVLEERIVYFVQDRARQDRTALAIGWHGWTFWMGGIAIVYLEERCLSLCTLHSHQYLNRNNALTVRKKIMQLHDKFSGQL